MSGRHGADPAVGDVDLLAEILRGVPKLKHAACVGQSDLFDAERAGDVQRARKICSSCPCRQPCSDWIQGRRDVTGVVAGELRFRRDGAPKKRHRPSDDERETNR